METDLPQTLWTTLNKIQEAIGVSHELFAEMLDLSPARVARLREKRKCPPLASLVLLSEVLNLPLEGIFRDTLDYWALTRSYRGNIALPERYQSHAFSRRRTSVNVLAYLDVNFGAEFRNNILKMLQVPEGLMQDQDAPISIRFLEDLTDLLREFGTPEESFVHMGFMSHFTNLGSPLAEKLSKSDSVRGLHEHLFSEYIQLYEKNHDYRIVQLTDRSIVFASRQRKEVLDALDRKRFGSHSICMMRLGTTISLPGYLGLPYGQGKHTHCVHRGDPECRFEIEFPDPVRRPSSGLSAVPNR